MIFYAVAFLVGCGLGSGAYILHRRAIEKAVAIEREESQETIRQLKRNADQFFAERNALLRERELQNAYNEGRKSPLSDVEKFAMKLEERHARMVDTSREA